MSQPSNAPIAWPRKEARALWHHLKEKIPAKGYVLFATGYGPSGLPHIGTFGEVARTAMVRKALSEITDAPTRLYVFSDDMDGLRSVPDHIPQPAMLEKNLGKPLSAIPDPYETHESYAAHNNALLQEFLNQFDFSYEFQSATQLYQSGAYDEMLQKILFHHEAVCEIVRPVLGAERRAHYSPFLPICPTTGRVLEVPIVATDIHDSTITYRHEGRDITTPVTGGRVKLQWRADWAMRWAAMDVDYEMAGKDLTDSLQLSAKISRLLNKKPPCHFIYELFLDEHGEKISKSKGNGISMEKWLRYAPPDSLRYFMYQHPRRAKRLYFDVIPRMTDAWLEELKNYHNQTTPHRANPLSIIHDGESPDASGLPAFSIIHDGELPDASGLPAFSMILNLASACNAHHESVLWNFLRQYDSRLHEGMNPLLDQLVACAMNYYHDFIHPQKQYKIPNDEIRQCLKELKTSLDSLTQHDGVTIQNCLYDTYRASPYKDKNSKDWFSMLYQVLLGQREGPRLGSFIAFYGVEATVSLIDDALKREGD